MKKVSVIVPCYNEEATIRLLLEAIYQQSYPLEDLEVVIADGMSTDHTRQKIADFLNEHPRLHLRLVDNTKRAIPSGLNRAIEAAQGEYLVRLDAHSVPAANYIEECVAALDNGYGDNVGGIWKIQSVGKGWIARSIAAAAAHPLGVGDALYRVGANAQYVDTVPFGAFRREMAVQIGLFDESLLTNEDYEFNMRIRNAGGRIWLDPAIQSIYFTRSNLRSLAQQYWRYGYWKAQMLRRYPKSIRWRQALPPLFSASLLGLFISGFFFSLAWKLLALELASYIGIMLIAGLSTALVQKSLGYLAGLPLAIGTMHIAWGTALLWGIIHPVSASSLTK
ncbi:MAG: glycosyl transferase [Chloroflexi bacterium RBG_19FT_COMBO_49_13]|nr:MAG: glycosyl transferase [Chloroflexi bacterium RBG_19FT_COMBO_49_13]